MKVLYVANRWDPRVQNEFSGNDYGAFYTIKNMPGVQLELVGPFKFPPSLLERIYWKFGHLVSNKPVKHSNSYLFKSAKIVQAAIQRCKPDVVFSRYSAPLVKADIKVPVIYLCDSTVVWSRDIAKSFSSFDYNRMEKWEEKVIRMSSKVITFSHSNAKSIIETYNKSPEDVVVMPIPSQLPKYLIPDKNSITKSIDDKINLLLVGKRYHLRGVDIAIEIVQQLNSQGLNAELRIVGMNGEDSDNVIYRGVYKKELPGAVEAYVENFKWAHLLIHPSRFHSAGIVISEAAGFGVPTITNNVGGLATTVKDGITGVVLPANSPAELYVKKIKELMENGEIYHSMQKSARSRFDEELHWDVAGKTLVDCIQSVTNR